MNTKKIKVLAIDDIYANRFLLQDVLSNFRIKTVETLDQFWQNLEHDGADIVLLDIMMPEEDGFSLAKKMKADDRYKNIPIIFISAKNAKTDVMEGIKSGGSDYLVKPIDGDLLIEKIMHLLYQNLINIISTKYSISRKMIFMRTGNFRLILKSPGKLQHADLIKILEKEKISVTNALKADQLSGLILVDNINDIEASQKKEFLSGFGAEIEKNEIIEVTVIGKELHQEEVNEINGLLSLLEMSAAVSTQNG